MHTWLVLSVMLVACLPAGLRAQHQAQAPIDFRTPDGTRIVLVPTTGAPIVHWAVATPIGPDVDPPAAPGLAAACAHASMRGSWTIGSLDSEREQRALLQLDQAEVDLLRAPRGPGGSAPKELADRVDELRKVAAGLADEQAFRRVLLGAPAQTPRISLTDGAAILTMSTIPSAIEDVAKLLFDRREKQALRGFRADYARVQDAAAKAWDQQPLAPLRSEAMALAYPGSALARAGDRPTTAGISRQLAEVAWLNSQHPTRTVHVLTGNFDLDQARAALVEVFGRTSMAQLLPLHRARVRPGRARLQAVVPGGRYPAALIAWPLAGDEDRDALLSVAEWLAGGHRSWLARELEKRGRSKLRIEGRAPWPDAAAVGMLVIEVADLGEGGDNLAEQILQLCATKAARAPHANELQMAYNNVLAVWSRNTKTPADLAAHFAERLLEHPETRLPLLPPRQPDLTIVPALLQKVFARQPIVVEWRSS